jgi:hypothetical protein
MITRGVSEPEAFEDYAKDWAGIGIMPPDLLQDLLQDIRLAGCAVCRNVRSKRTRRIKSPERSGVAQKRLRFVFLEFL